MTLRRGPSSPVVPRRRMGGLSRLGAPASRGKVSEPEACRAAKYEVTRRGNSQRQWTDHLKDWLEDLRQGRLARLDTYERRCTTNRRMLMARARMPRREANLWAALCLATGAMARDLLVAFPWGWQETGQATLLLALEPFLSDLQRAAIQWLGLEERLRDWPVSVVLTDLAEGRLFREAVIRGDLLEGLTVTLPTGGGSCPCVEVWSGSVRIAYWEGTCGG